MAIFRSAVFTTSVVLIMYAREITSEVQLHRTSTFCRKTTSNNEINCNLLGNDARLLEGNWNDFSKCVFTNASSLVILPQCTSADIFFSIYNTTKVMTDLRDIQHAKDCRVRLDIENCSGVRLGDYFSQISVSNSTVEYLKMAVDKFDIKSESVIESLHIKGSKENSKLSNSKVNIVDLLKIEGIRNAEISHSKVGIVKKFIYNASSSSDIYLTEIGDVERNGFEIWQGLLKFINVTFISLPPESIIIHSGTVLLKDVSIKESDVRSIAMKGDSKINFENVNLWDELLHFSIEFTYKGNQSASVFGLVLTGNQSSSVTVNIVIGLTISIVFWIVVFVSAYFCRRNFLSPCARNSSGNNIFPPTNISVHPSDAKPLPPSPVTTHLNNTKSRETDNTDEDDYEPIENMKPCHTPFLLSDGPPEPPSNPPPKRFPPLPHSKALKNVSGSNQYFGVGNVCKDSPAYENCKDFQNPHSKSQANPEVLAKRQIHLQNQNMKDVVQQYDMGGVSERQQAHNISDSENFKANKNTVASPDLSSNSEIPRKLQGNKMFHDVLQKGNTNLAIKKPAENKKSFLHSGRTNLSTFNQAENCSVSSRGNLLRKLPIDALARKFGDQHARKNQAEQDPDDLYEPIPEH